VAELFRVESKMLKLFSIIFIIVGFLLNVSSAISKDKLNNVIEKDGNYVGPTVEENVVAMDTDKNGFADVTEVRAYLAIKNGPEYEKDILDRWQLRSQGRSCTLPPDEKIFNQSK
jgi:hypothetical protein